MFVSVELGPCILSNGLFKIAFSCWVLQCMFVSVELGPCILSKGFVKIAVSCWVLQQMSVSRSSQLTGPTDWPADRPTDRLTADWPIDQWTTDRSGPDQLARPMRPTDQPGRTVRRPPPPRSMLRQHFTQHWVRHREFVMFLEHARRQH